MDPSGQDDASEEMPWATAWCVWGLATPFLADAPPSPLPTKKDGISISAVTQRVQCDLGGALQAYGLSISRSNLRFALPLLYCPD